MLDLVYNPGGAFLPPNQSELEIDYKKRLFDDHGIVFNRLLTLTNMPIARFGSMLISKGQFESYMSLLRDNYESSNMANLMCKNTLSVDWQGYCYDCDFNQMLDMPMTGPSRNRLHLRDLLDSLLLDEKPVRVADHCFGCTAGQGSSCGGALV